MKRLWSIMACLLFLTGCAADSVPVSYDIAEECIMTVALTFDDGPDPICTPLLLDGLRERGVCATFFLVGSRVEENPDLARRIAEEGHQIGNHTYDHANLEKLTEWEAKQDLKKNSKLLCEIIGEGTYWIRAPYGLITEGEKQCLDVPLIRWSVDTEDWKNQSVEAILDILYGDITDGGIILMHDSYLTSVEAALQAIDYLSAQGVRFVTVQELFRQKGLTPQGGVQYSKAE